MKPSGKYLMNDIYNKGGTTMLLKYLLDNGLLSGDCMTVTGKTLEENLDHIKLNDTHFLCTDILKQIHL